MIVREFYSNFQYKDGKYVCGFKGKLITFNKELFLEVGGLANDGSPLGDCNNELWNSYYSTEMYKSCLRGPHYYCKARSLIVENKLLHYLIAYVLVQRNTSHAQPPVKEGIMVNWFVEIMKVMSGIASSLSRLMAYGIFISHVIEHVGIDTTNEDLIVVKYPSGHLTDDSLIHKMSICKYGGVWMCEEEYQTINEILDEDEDVNLAKQTQASQRLRLLLYLKNRLSV
ncbi:hypothetical protein Lal_00000657 [Lupinus albus]|nr:hypothetical protein Lal_00000657 [Lupinus albus]